MNSKISFPRTVVALLALVVFVAAGCAGQLDGSGSPSAELAVVASSSSDVVVYPSPDAVEPHLVLSGTTPFGSRRVLAVVSTPTDGRVEVALPTRPNGATGWVEVGSVDLRPVRHRVAVDLSARVLTVHVGEEVVLRTPVAIGSDDDPTPTGSFYVTDRVESNDPGGAYGPYAFGLSVHSDTRSEFAGGEGQIGIHGTNDPASIGEAVSHGCIRVPNDVAVELADLLPLGTPVVIGPGVV